MPDMKLPSYFYGDEAMQFTYFRILKLFLYAEDGEQELAAYERGWSIYPTGEHEASMDALLAFCAKLPPADDWHIRAGEEKPTLC